MVAEKKKIYLSPPHMSGKERRYVDEVFASNWIAPLGPQVDAFEKDLALYLGVLDAAVLISGTAALHLSLLLLNVKPGDRVFCSTLTFAATANPIIYAGAEPVFIDSDPETWNMSLKALKCAFKEADREGTMPKAIIVVNLYGQSADFKPIITLCNDYRVPVIEDAAESLGATYKGKMSGSLGKIGILSFNGNKIITTSGGGAIVSEDPDLISRARYLATQARQPARHYEHTEVGYNYRMSNVLAGIGRGQLEVLDERVKLRRAVFERYSSSFKDINGFDFMPEAGYGRSTRWLTVLTVNPELCGISRDQIIEALEAENIEARPVWKPMQLQPLYREYKYYAHQDSVSERLFEFGLCLPSGSSLTEADQERVIDVIWHLVKQ
jgi:pyridoxal phosphate-dependent aminotransferase EpsN